MTNITPKLTEPIFLSIHWLHKTIGQQTIKQPHTCTPAVDDCSILHRQIISELDKYLQEATEKHEQDDNYYDG